MSVHWLLRINVIRKRNFLKLFFEEIYNYEFLKSSPSVCNVSILEELYFKTLAPIEFIFMDSIQSRGTTVFVASSAVGVDTR